MAAQPASSTRAPSATSSFPRGRDASELASTTASKRPARNAYGSQAGPLVLPFASQAMPAAAATSAGGGGGRGPGPGIKRGKPPALPGRLSVGTAQVQR